MSDSHDLSDDEVFAWSQEIRDRMRALLQGPADIGARDEFEILTQHHDALMDEMGERNRRHWSER